MVIKTRRVLLYTTHVVISLFPPDRDREGYLLFIRVR